MRTVSLVIGIFSVIAAHAASAQTDGPVLVTSPVDKVFVPLGFDDNDNVEVVVHGHFPNTCYKTGPVTFVIDENAHSISIQSQSYYYQGVGCAQVMVPFTQSVKLGLMKASSYRIEVVDRPEAETVPLAIAEARTSNPDDYLYAPVSTVEVDEPSDGAHALRLEGEYPYTLEGCMFISDVRFYVSPGNTLVVLPIAELTDREDHPACVAQSASKKFSVNVDIGGLAREEFLVHVRSLSGNSLNRLIDLY